MKPAEARLMGLLGHVLAEGDSEVEESNVEMEELEVLVSILLFEIFKTNF